LGHVLNKTTKKRFPLKHFSIAVFLLAVFSATAQTTSTTVAPTFSNGVAEYTFPDGNGGTFVVEIPAPSAVISHIIPVVVPPPPPVGPVAPTIPSTATAVSLITSGTWKACEHDAGTPGTGTCSNNYPVTGIFADSARGFSMSYTGAGGVRWANSFANDTKATNFVLDAMVQSPDWTHVADLELDTNQVKADGKTTILGTQCASQEGAWDVTFTGTNGAWHWSSTGVKCDPRNWTPNTPHHIRIFGTISASDVSTYLGVEFDGVYTPFSGETGNTADALGWGKGVVLDNVQIDGFGASGSATVYMDRLTIFRW
jgi:hypothetical protein